MLADIDPRKAADIDVLGKSRARMHADLAVDDNPRIGLPHEPQRGPLARILTHARADRRGTAAEGEEASGASDHLAVPAGVGNLLRGDVALLHRGEDAERNHMAVTRSMGDIAGAQERRRGKEPSHGAEVVGALWDDIGPRRPFAPRVGRREQRVLPRGVVVEVVPGDVFVHHGARRGMRGHVVDRPSP